MTADNLADAINDQRWVTHDWHELRAALDELPPDNVLRMGKDELRAAINRVLLERQAVESGANSALVSGVL